MNWFNVIKNPELRVGSKVTTNLSSTSDNQPDEPCKKKLLEYRPKMKNRKGLLTKLDIEVYAFQEKEGVRESKYGGLIREEVEYYLDNTSLEASFSALPEDVACKALKMLSGMSGNSTILNKQIGDNYWCEVTRLIMPKNRVYGLSDMQYMFFEIGLMIMTDNSEGPVVIDFTHRIYLPINEVRENIKEYDILLDKMDWR